MAVYKLDKSKNVIQKEGTSSVAQKENIPPLVEVHTDELRVLDDVELDSDGFAKARYNMEFY